MQVLELDVPEYFVTHIGRAERLTGSVVRFTMCTVRGDHLEPRYACVWPIESLLSRTELVAVVGRDYLGEVATH